MGKYITNAAVKRVIDVGWTENGKRPPREIIDAENLWAITDPQEIFDLVFRVLGENQPLVKQYQAGKVEILNSIIGKIMKASNRRIDPDILTMEPWHILPVLTICYNDILARRQDHSSVG